MRMFARIKEKIVNIKEKIFLGMILAQAMMYAGPARADGPFTPTPGDVSVQMLAKIFGGLVNSGGGADPLKDLIVTFNGAILAVGGILVAYTIFAGTIGTAHEGEMLGRKFSSVWVPLRTAIATALVVPINGYCAMQMMVMWLIMQGIGLADTVWSAVVQGDALQSSTISLAAQSNPEIKQLAQKVLQSSICLAAAQKNSDSISNGITAGQQWSVYQYTNNANSDLALNFGVKDSLFNTNSCGNIILNTTKEQDRLKDSGNLGTATIQSMQSGDDTAIRTAHNNATNTMIATAAAAAPNFFIFDAQNKTLVFNNRADFSIIDKMAAAYTSTVHAAVSSYYAKIANSENSIKANAQQDGWIMAGGWFNKIANELTKVSLAMSNIPSMGTSDSITGLSYGPVNDVLAKTKEKISAYAAKTSNGISKENTAEDVNSNSFFSKALNFAASAMVGVDIREIANQTNMHPVVQMKVMGDRMVTSSTTFITLIVSAAAAGGTIASTLAGKAVGTDGGWQSAVLLIAPIAFTIFGSILTLGFFLSYYIPMIPFLIWLGCVIGWFILVLEAVIAAPLWAVMHLHPNGDDVTGRGGSGYMLVLGLLIRPTLMICGLIFALILSMVLGKFINSIFFDVFTMSRQGDSIGIFGTLLGYALYTTMMITFMHKMFSVIHVIPDQLLKWIGGGQEQLGSYAGALVQGTEGQFMKAGGIAGALGSQGLQVGTTALQRAQQRKLTMGQQANDNKLAARKEANESAISSGVSMDQAKSLGGLDQPASAAGQDGAQGGGQGGTKGGGELSQLKAASAAMGKLSEGQQQLKAAGAGAADIAKFNAAAHSLAEGFAAEDKASGGTPPGAPSPLDRGIAEAKNDFFNDNIGPGASGIIAAAATTSSGTDANKQAVASSKLSKAANALENSPSQKAQMLSDISNAVSGNVGALSQDSRAALVGYESSHGNKYDANASSNTSPEGAKGRAASAAAAINALTTHYTEGPSGGGNSGPSGGGNGSGSGSGNGSGSGSGSGSGGGNGGGNAIQALQQESALSPTQGTTSSGSQGTTSSGSQGTTSSGSQGTTSSGSQGTTSSGSQGTTSGGSQGTTSGGGQGTTSGGGQGTTSGGGQSTTSENSAPAAPSPSISKAMKDDFNIGKKEDK